MHITPELTRFIQRFWTSQDTDRILQQQRDDLYQHIYEKYADAEHNVYAAG